MAQLSDGGLITVALDYGEAAGTGALAKALRVTEKHAGRFRKTPSKRLNQDTRVALMENLPMMLEKIEAYRQIKAGAARALKRVEDGPPGERTTNGDGPGEERRAS